MSISIEDFCSKYEELEALAMTYLNELLRAQNNTPPGFREYIVHECNGYFKDALKDVVL